MSSLSSTRSSPIPDLAFDPYRSLSLRDQTLIKRQQAGHSSSSSQHQPGGNNLDSINSPNRPRLQNPNIQQNLLRLSENPKDFVTVQGETYALAPYTTETLIFWILLAILIVLVIANSTLTFIIFGSLRLGKGMESIEFLPNFIKFYGDVDLDEVNKLDGLIRGFGDEGMEIRAQDGGKINLRVHEGNGPSISIDKTGINIGNVDEFRVMSRTGERIFTTKDPILDLPNGVRDLRVQIAKVNRVTSAINSSLEFSSTSSVYLKGNEGIRMEGKEIFFSAKEKDILFKAIKGDMILAGNNGVNIYTRYLPLVLESDVTRNQYTNPAGKKHSQFKLCICMPSGRIFRVEIPLNNRKNGNRKIGCKTFVYDCLEKEF